MTPEQALSVLIQIAALAPVPKSTHVQADTAAKVLADAINDWKKKNDKPKGN